MEKFAAGLLSAGLKTDDRILICGNNHSQLVIAVLGASRAGMVRNKLDVLRIHITSILHFGYPTFSTKN